MDKEERKKRTVNSITENQEQFEIMRKIEKSYSKNFIIDFFFFLFILILLIIFLLNA